MPQRTVRFTIRPDGRVEERVEGVIGPACQQLTESLEAALGPLNAKSPLLNPFSRPIPSPSPFLRN